MAAQEMSGWWSLTSTTKADSAQPAVLGGRSAVEKVLAGTTSATPHRSTGVIMALPKATIVTGGLEGHGSRVEVETEVWVPLAWSVCSVPQHDSAL